ncbi:MAG: pentapeptide repeat-containing protein [Rickettsiales bacterium]|nr:pentapeptide repeat-containing protein [Rickettsiales bacterium]
MSDDDVHPLRADTPAFKEYCDRYAIPYAAEHAAKAMLLKSYTDPMITPALVQSQRDFAIAANHLQQRGEARHVPLMFDQASADQQREFMETLKEGVSQTRTDIDLINLSVDHLPPLEKRKEYLWNTSLSEFKQLEANGCALRLQGKATDIYNLRCEDGLFGGNLLLGSLTSAKFKNSDLFGNIIDCDVIDSTFDHCLFENMGIINQPDITLDEPVFHDCTFKDCKFTGVDMSHLHFDACTFDHCTFEDVDMQSVKMTDGTAFINDCDLCGVRNISTTKRDDTVQIERSETYPLGNEQSIVLKRNLVGAGEAQKPASVLSIGGDKPARDVREPMRSMIDHVKGSAANDN